MPKPANLHLFVNEQNMPIDLFVNRDLAYIIKHKKNIRQIRLRITVLDDSTPDLAQLFA